MVKKTMNQALIFGEILFDCLPNGEEILGGAPFNVAWNLQGFAHGGSELGTTVISRLGEDERGARVLKTMKEWEMSTEGVQRDNAHPTGVAIIESQNGQHSFDLKPEQAYDYIDPAAAAKHATASEATMLYHGSLALRNEVSRDALEAIRETRNLPMFVDLNLREPWWKQDQLAGFIEGARWLKLNDEELGILTGIQPGDIDSEIAAAKDALLKFNLAQLVVTRGGTGAFVIDADKGTLVKETPPLKDIVDTVGAGDAFASVWILGLQENWDPETALGRAAEFAAQVCCIPGATSIDREMYRSFTEKWG